MIGGRFGRAIRALIQVDPQDRSKLLFLAICFFFVIGAYTVAKELKDSIFIAIVGGDYQPRAKMLSMIVLIPAILLYSRSVDFLRRYQLLYVYTGLYGVLGLVFAYFMGHPTIGLPNQCASPDRIFGWLFYFFIEGYSPFVVSVFWAFANSISSPQEAKNNYGLMVVGSKLGGMLTAGTAWWLISRNCAVGGEFLSEVALHQILTVGSSVILLLTPLVVYKLMHTVSGRFLHGYEAVYRAEKAHTQEIQQEPFNFIKSIKSSCGGLIQLVRNPYVFGIFGIVIFYELVNVVFGFQRLRVIRAASTTTSDVSAFLFQQSFWQHAVGLVFALVGTRMLLSRFGERRSLILMPILTGLLVILFTWDPSPHSVLLVVVLMRALHYGVGQPLRESLYIPTTKEVKFKSKSWIDTFGARFARFVGGGFNDVTRALPLSMALGVDTIFFLIVVGLWLIVAYFLGRLYERAVAHNQVIGLT